MFRSAGDRMYQVGSEHQHQPVDLSLVYIHGQWVPKVNLAEFLKSKRCVWRHVFLGGGCE